VSVDNGGDFAWDNEGEGSSSNWWELDGLSARHEEAKEARSACGKDVLVAGVGAAERGERAPHVGTPKGV